MVYDRLTCLIAHLVASFYRNHAMIALSTVVGFNLHNFQRAAYLTYNAAYCRLKSILIINIETDKFDKNLETKY